MGVKIKTSSEIKSIAASGAILAEVFKKTAKEAKIGTVLKDLDKLAFRLIKESGAEPAFLNYRPNGALKPYPATICASVNNVIVHGLPNDYRLKNGDVLKLDFGVKYNGFYSDAAITIGIGTISPEAGKLIKATKIALEEAIKIAEPGNFLGDIGWVIEKIAKKFGVKTIKELTGHGIGRELHEDPTIYNFGKRGKGIELKSGMVLAIEPMFAVGTEKIIQKKDESWATANGSLSAHFEHTVAITDKGPKILTIDN
ncbi:type I methionyl aminopeptidase [Candidatus Wolfebacteria bacterium CG02_land_8_20_14_3_00_37_12]|uniref:Methionine aminopeptidase n=3 Tax=Candidatus Wolfeibacteriota TaxID=1752735 RepID=A0A2M7Q7D6_9BACT|nr:MAG: type I methionyl aminopeptidase [Candidatus Wolfebacteria bacterium CG02_land_8_20_14_3_00_37_12]PIY59351.1 MAG: type I methionyl aminopeptidase [Candidatus Wolfebacteria bacterium CG_4_10_14_0_8_um_filter_37_11]PJA41883.1 MAG: type I methionyl aminopeptidase [Candidatus Wolfebacteria bacterium CG_4_9_14_3_um_filter_37_9]